MSKVTRETCPFYEEHSGEYYQGCWEANDICWAAMYFDKDYQCKEDCWFYAKDSDKALAEAVDNALSKQKRVWHFDREPTWEPLTKEDKHAIISVMDQSLEALLTLESRNGLYK